MSDSDEWPPGDRVKEYTAPGVTVRYDARRCAHAAECVNRLPAVFDTARRPWIDPGAADPAAIAEVVTRCPSGALHYALPDGPGERGPVPPTVTAVPNGPLRVHGEFVVEGHREVRAFLCRCGHSANKPFCDGSHLRAGWTDGSTVELTACGSRTPVAGSAR